MYRIPLANRFEVIHTYDAGLAVANAMRTEEIWGKTLLIGGGPRCQIYYRDYLGRMLDLTSSRSPKGDGIPPLAR